MDPRLFYTKAGLMFPGFSLAQVQGIRRELVSKYEISWSQMAEGAAYSLAMVMRYSLGLSLLEAQVGVIVGGGFAGLVALAGARQMQNAGAGVRLVRMDGALPNSPEIEAAMRTLNVMGVPQHGLDDIESSLSGVHAVILAGVDVASNAQLLPPSVVEYLNESAVPIHCIDAPPGIDLETGTTLTGQIFAASTLAVGLPLAALHTAREVAGRIYLCDTSIPRELYKVANTNLGRVFTEQPIQQIFPKID